MNMYHVYQVEITAEEIEQWNLGQTVEIADIWLETRLHGKADKGLDAGRYKRSYSLQANDLEDLFDLTNNPERQEDFLAQYKTVRSNANKTMPLNSVSVGDIITWRDEDGFHASICQPIGWKDITEDLK